jgi:hypothetical protein
MREIYTHLLIVSSEIEPAPFTGGCCAVRLYGAIELLNDATVLLHMCSKRCKGRFLDEATRLTGQSEKRQSGKIIRRTCSLSAPGLYVPG